MSITHKLTETIDQAIFGYDPSEFMPIRENGEVINKTAFVAYKATRIIQSIGELANRHANQ